jgi:hypothetical protein
MIESVKLSGMRISHAFDSGSGTSNSSYSLTQRSRSALPTTLTDDSAIAVAANIGESVRPITG